MNMSKLNQPGKSRSTNIRQVAAERQVELAVSANGNLQFKKEPLQMLYELVVQTMIGKDGQLKSGTDLVRQIKANVKTAVDMGAYDFVANLAIHARTEMNVRTVPLIVVVEFAKALSDKRQAIVSQIDREVAGQVKLVRVTGARKAKIEALQAEAAELNYGNMRQLVCDVIQRADQITDLYAYALEVFGNKNKVPMAIKRGVSDAFNKFSEYAFAKYNRDGSVKFRDVLRIVHPSAKDARQGAIFDKIMKEQLQVPYTWETELSMNGQLPAAERKTTKQLWTELVTSGKIGYMALLRNLRNIHQAGLDAAVLREHVYNVIADPKRVADSKQLPYDFMEAYNIVKDLDSKMATAVSKAIDLSVTNIPKMGNRVWMIVDYSGSMGRENVETSAFSSAVFLTSALVKANADTDKLAVTLFGSSAKTLKGIDTNNSMIALQKELTSHRKDSIAGSTEFYAALQEKSKLGFEPDTIVVLTDGEINRFPYGALKTLTGKNVIKMVVNLSAAHSTPMVKEDGWYAMAGWSPAMFRWVPAMREKVNAVDQLCVPYVGVPKKERVAE
jgi:60 kDa SS-A/Ro ribonucleoprotein